MNKLEIINSLIKSAGTLTVKDNTQNRQSSTPSMSSNQTTEPSNHTLSDYQDLVNQYNAQFGKHKFMPDVTSFMETPTSDPAIADCGGYVSSSQPNVVHTRNVWDAEGARGTLRHELGHVAAFNTAPDWSLYNAPRLSKFTFQSVKDSARREQEFPSTAQEFRAGNKGTSFDSNLYDPKTRLLNCTLDDLVDPNKARLTPRDVYYHKDPIDGSVHTYYTRPGGGYSVPADVFDKAPMVRRHKNIARIVAEQDALLDRRPDDTDTTWDNRRYQVYNDARDMFGTMLWQQKDYSHMPIEFKQRYARGGGGVARPGGFAFNMAQKQWASPANSQTHKDMVARERQIHDLLAPYRAGLAHSDSPAARYMAPRVLELLNDRIVTPDMDHTKSYYDIMPGDQLKQLRDDIQREQGIYNKQQQGAYDPLNDTVA